MSRPFLSLADATFRLGERVIFENTSWDFRQGEQWAIVGGNGSGKSLLADALRGALPLVGGEMRYHFVPPPGLVAEESIGLVSFERRKLDLHDAVVQSRWNSIEEEAALRVRDFLSYERVMDVNPFEVTDRHNQARPAFERRQREAISLLDTESFLDRALMTLSNGEMQRVQLTRALCRPMRLLILDEPFAGLDISAREYLHRLLGRLMRTSLRVLLIATRTEDLPSHVTHLLCVDQCRVIGAGPIKEGTTNASLRKLISGGKTVIPKPEAKPSRTARLREAGSELVRLRKISVRYGDSIILHDLDWTIRAGESWALLGPNGSGKSTLLSLIQGDHPQVYMNDVTVFGQQRGTGESMWEIKKRIGWFSPELLLHFDSSMSCFEVVASGFFDTVGLFESVTERQRAAVRRILAAYGLTEYLECPLYGLSAGLQRLVLLLRALVKKPRLLILDEPCQGLDRAHREFFVAAVESVIRSGTITVIYVTHRADELPKSIRKTLRLSKRAKR